MPSTFFVKYDRSACGRFSPVSHFSVSREAVLLRCRALRVKIDVIEEHEQGQGYYDHQCVNTCANIPEILWTHLFVYFLFPFLLGKLATLRQRLALTGALEKSILPGRTETGFSAPFLNCLYRQSYAQEGERNKIRK